MYITESKRRMLHIYQTILLIEDSLLRKEKCQTRNHVIDIVKDRIIEQDMAIDMVLYRLTGCYMPKIVKQNIRLIFTPQFVTALIKKCTNDDVSSNFPNGISINSVLGKDHQGVSIWESIKNVRSIKNAINYTKIKSPKNQVFV